MVISLCSIKCIDGLNRIETDFDLKPYWNFYFSVSSFEFQNNFKWYNSHEVDIFDPTLG